ncbi:MAG: ABC transporter substrate-binding protein [Treponema sp.]|nr:ABC transporter substrate-binding protein [Treponema sp.]
MKRIMLILTMLIAVSAMVFATGSRQSSSGPSTPGMTYKGHDVSQTITLVAYMLGDLHPDGQQIIDRVNTILRSTINATIEWRYLSWSEHGTRYPLLFTSQDDFDIIFTAPQWAHYESTVGMGGFEPMTQTFVQRFAPDVWNIIPAEAWDQLKINGIPYAVPSGEAALRSDVNAVRGDFMEMAGIRDISTFDQLISFFTWIANNQNRTGGVSPLGASTGGFLYNYFRQNNLQLLPGTPYEILFYNFLQPNNTRVAYLLDQSWFRQYCLDMKRYFEAGFWSRDSLASTSTYQENFLRGQAASFSWNIGSVLNFLQQADSEHPNWKVTFVDPELTGYKWVEDYNNNNLAINAFSRKKERAMMALNELYSNREINRLLRYGIEGVHYNVVNQLYYQTTAQSNRYPVAGNAPAWVIKNPAFTLEQYIPNPTVYQLKEQEVRKVWERNKAPSHPLTRFTLDTSNITTQIAMINTIQEQYFTPLISGMAGDVDAAIATLRTQLDRAGIQDVINEANRQIQSYMSRR